MILKKHFGHYGREDVLAYALMWAFLFTSAGCAVFLWKAEAVSSFVFWGVWLSGLVCIPAAMAMYLLLPHRENEGNEGRVNERV